MSWEILEGDCREVLGTLPAESVHTVVTSPPYFGLRDYGTGEWIGGDVGCEHRPVGGRGSYGKENGASRYRGDGLRGATNRAHVEGAPHRGGRANECACGARREDAQIGLEPSPDEFAQALVEVFRQVRRVLRDDGTVWLNLGDSYAAAPPGNGVRGVGETSGLKGAGSDRYRENLAAGHGTKRDTTKLAGIKSKDLIGIPWMVAFALRADGWYLRSDIIWAKPNPMPESITDRPTKAHEYLFLLSKSPRYYYDAAAICEPAENAGRTITLGAKSFAKGQAAGSGRTPSGNGLTDAYEVPEGRNRRTVWTVATQPFPGAHFATFPPKLIEPCVLAGAPEGGVVLDPFAGAGTTGLVAARLKRSFVGIELNPSYAELARERIETDIRLGHRSPQRAAEPLPGQTSLLDGSVAIDLSAPLDTLTA